MSQSERAPGFLAVSVEEGAAAPDFDRASRAIRSLGDAVVELEAPEAGRVVELSKGLRTTSGPFGAPGQTEITPPGAAAWSTATGWAASTDEAGLHHVYWRQGPGWGAISTCAVALGALTGPRSDAEALRVAALVGHALGNRTVVADVQKLEAGEACSLVRGRIEVTGPVQAAVSPEQWAGATRATAAEGAEAVRSIVAEALEAAGRPVLELSGGLDSRVVLAAVPREARRDLPAFTIGTPESPDVIVAREIARRERLDHDVVDTRELARLAPEEAEALVLSAGREADWASNAVALGVLRWIEARLADDRPRLSGQNGEFGRGFYYALVPRWVPNTATSRDALARWRLIANDQVDRELLRPDELTRAREDALAAIGRLVPVGPFLPATDELYLRARMARWLGPAYTLSSRDRPVLAPFLDPRYLAWARATSPAQRRGSRAVAGVLDLLDSDLAALPLAGGTAPARIAAGGLGATLSTAPAVGRKVVAKVGQRIRPRARAPQGAGALCDLVRRAWSSRPDTLEGAAGSSLVRPEIVRAIARGERPAGAATVGFLAMLEELERPTV